MDNIEYKHSALTDKIIKVFYEVYNVLGYGFLEKCYESAMMIALKKYGLSAESQYPITVYYEGQVIGEYRADILVENAVIIELKAARELAPEHKSQVLNYLKATKIEIGLLLNFGIKPEIKRLTFDNERKTYLPQA